MTTVIETFRGKYSWLSNFADYDKPRRHVYQGVEMFFETNEHFYMAMKTLCPQERLSVSLHPKKGLKKFGRELTIRRDWDTIKLQVMYNGLRYKFGKRNPNLRKLLIDTLGMKIEEGNEWGDLYWGVDAFTRQGYNNLGKLLMKVRKEIMIEDNLL
jgi:ribA/ribD-fused uncharacterized protein